MMNLYILGIHIIIICMYITCTPITVKQFGYMYVCMHALYLDHKALLSPPREAHSGKTEVSHLP